MKQYQGILIVLGICVVISALMWNVPVQQPAPHEETPPATEIPEEPENPPSAPEPSEPTSVKQCYAGGCSGQLCTDDPNAVSTCEWTEAYACYQGATCEVQSDGECGWTQTPGLTACLEAAI